MNINGVDIVKKLEQHNEYLKFIAFLRECAKFYIEVHYYIHNNICMLDYPPEPLFDDFILQEDNEQIYGDPPELLFYDSIFKEEDEWLFERKENMFQGTPVLKKGQHGLKKDNLPIV